MTLPTAQRRTTGGDLLRSVAAGLVASVVVGRVDDALDRFVGRETRRRERRVREGSPHELAGPRFAAALAGRRLSRQERERARAAFAVTYGIVWGLVHGLVRQRIPAASRAAGLPFALPFYVVCDGVLAPLLGLTPTPRRIPAPLNAKELANHVAWTLAAELVHRGTRRLG